MPLKLERGGIIASGLGKNVPICEKFVGTLTSLGIRSTFLHTNTAIHGDLGAVHKNDIVILLSKSGNTTETVVLAQYLKERCENIWFISFNEHSDLTNVLDKKIILSLDNEGDKWNIVPNNSTTIYLIILQGLAIALQERLSITIEEFGKNHPGGGIGEKLKGIIECS